MKRANMFFFQISVFLILCGIIIAMVILWRLGRLSVMKENIQRRVTAVRKNISNRFSSAGMVIYLNEKCSSFMKFTVIKTKCMFQSINIIQPNYERYL